MTQGGDLGWPATQLTWGFSPEPPHPDSGPASLRGPCQLRSAAAGGCRSRLPSRAGRRFSDRLRLVFPVARSLAALALAAARRPAAAAASVSPRDRRGARLVAPPPRPEPRAHGTDRTRWCRSACPPHPRPGPAAGRCRHPALPGCPAAPSSHGAWQSWAVTWGRASFRPAQPVGSQRDEGAMYPSNEA